MIIQQYLAKNLLASRFFTAAIWSVLGTIISSGITMLLMLILARWFTTSDYGRLVLVQSTMLNASLLASLGLGIVATRYTAALVSRDLSRLSKILTICSRGTSLGGVTMTILITVIAKPFSSQILNTPDLSTLLILAAPSIFFIVQDTYFKSVLIGFEEIRCVALITTTATLVSLPVFLTLSHQYGLHGSAIAITIASLMQATLSYHFLGKKLKALQLSQNNELWLKEKSIVIKYALPALIAAAMLGPVHWLAQTILANKPDGLAQVAKLGIAMQWFNLITFIPVSAGKVLLPILTDNVADSNQKDSRRLLKYSVIANAITAIPVAIVLCWFSEPILSQYGNSYADDRAPFLLAVFTATLLACIGPIGTLMLASSRMWLAATTNVAWATVFIGLAFFLLGETATQITIALLIAYVFHSTWTIAYAYKLLR